MDEVEKRVLSQMRSKLVKEMVVTESFLSAFCHSNILDDSMSSILKCERNYEQRAGKLLDLLPSRGCKAFVTLMEILEITNPWLSEKMRAALHDERNKDAKINLHPSVAKSASIEGFGESRLHIDSDIKARSAKYVHTNLYHLTEAEQRGVEKWLADELQRERRRQQFRTPHGTTRCSKDFHSTKECQTETSVMDMRDTFEEVATYLHGVDTVEADADISFGTMQEQIRELLARTRKLDALFLNCLSKFDDTTKYSMTLPELIDKTVHHEKDLQQAESDSKKTIQKLRDDNEGFKRHIRRLEEHVDRLIQRQTQGMRPQEIQLRHRQDVHFRYTLPAPADSGHFAVNRMQRSGRDALDDRECDENGNIGVNGTEDNNSGHGPSHYNGMNGIDGPSAGHNCEGNRGTSGRVGSETDSRSSASGYDSSAGTKRKNSIDFSYHNSIGNGASNTQTFVNAAGYKLHKAEPVHYEDQNNVPHRNNWKGNAKSMTQVSHHSQYNNQRSVKNSKEQVNESFKLMNGSPSEQSSRLRRHASEESLRIEIGKEESEFTSTKWLDPTQFEAPGRRNSLDNSIQPATATHRQGSGSLDRQSRAQRMLPDASGQAKNITSGRQRESSPIIKGRSNVRIVHEESPQGHTKPTTKQNSKGVGPGVDFTDKALTPQQHTIFFHKTQSASHQAGHSPETPPGRQPYDNNNTVMPSGHRRYPYRSSSGDRFSGGAQQVPSLSVVSPVPHTTTEYMSDSEVVLKKSSLRGKTVRTERSRNKVRFSTPLAKNAVPQRKVPARTHHRLAHYQMDTASTALRKMRV